MPPSHTHDPALQAQTAGLYIAALISGMAALIYEVVWVHMLSLTFGSTTLAGAAVVGSFMAGMGLGARFFGPMGDRLRNPFLTYGLLEVGIAASAAAISTVIYSLPSVYLSLIGDHTGGLTVNLVRFAMAFVFLLVPSALMGATFPALCRAVIRSRHALGQHLGPVYGLNTIGAALGALLSGLVLIEWVGLTGTIRFANAANIVAATIALVMVRHGHVTASETTPAEPSPPTAPARLGVVPTRLVASVILFSGFATMAYEVSWFRAAKYIVGNSTYAISLVLTVFLIGLGLGGTLHRILSRRSRPLRDLMLCQVLIACLALGAVGLEYVILSNETLAQQLSIFSRTVSFTAWPARLALAGGVISAILIPPTLFMGLAFPIGSALYVRSIRTLSTNLGTAYFLANVGSILGVAAGALILLPYLGIIGTTKAVAGVNLALAVALWVAIRRAKVRSSKPFFLLAIPCLLLIVLLPSKMAFRGELEHESHSRLLFWEEGDLGTVKVIRQPDQSQGMTIDGYSIGVNRLHGRETGYKQQVLAHLPMAIAPFSLSTLNIGLGSATTLSSLGRYQSLTSLDCVEISQSVADGARLFDEGAVLDDSRVTLHIDDALHYLLRTEKRYDIIIADGKQNPQFSGNAALLSREFYLHALDRLAPEGIMVQWIPLNYTPRAFRIVLRTFLDVFPEVQAYYFPPTCAILVGSPGSIDIPWDYMHGYHAALVRQDLLTYGIADPMQLLTGLVAERDGLDLLLQETEPNTWDEPRLEFVTYKDYSAERNQEYYFRNTKLLLDAGRNLSERTPPVPTGRQSAMQSSAIIREGMLEVMRTLDLGPFRTACAAALAVNPNDMMAQMFDIRIEQGIRAVMRPGRPRPN